MSLSNDGINDAQAKALVENARKGGETRFVSGRVFLGTGVNGDGVSTVAQLENGRHHGWDDEAGRKYMERVRERAQAKAQEIMAKAMAEAQEIKRGAFEEGLREGLTAAAQEARALREQLAESLEKVLNALSSQGRKLYEHQARDIESLVCLAVERIVGLEISERRKEVLGTLLEQAVEAIEAKRKLTITVNPQDRELLGPLLEGVQAMNPGMAHWTIQDSPRIEPGSLKLETEEGLVENTMSTRRAEVEAVLSQLSLTAEDVPEDDDAADGEPAA